MICLVGCFSCFGAPLSGSQVGSGWLRLAQLGAPLSGLAVGSSAQVGSQALRLALRLSGLAVGGWHNAPRLTAYVTAPRSGLAVGGWARRSQALRVGSWHALRLAQISPTRSGWRALRLGAAVPLRLARAQVGSFGAFCLFVIRKNIQKTIN
jgi:hypothetical protein